MLSTVNGGRIRFSDLTTLGVGGEIATLLRASTEAELIEAARQAWSSSGEWLVLGGGSNVFAGDDPFNGTVIRVESRGVERISGAAIGSERIRVQAGEPWDAFVEWSVAQGLAGIEALSGIPGTVGAAPIQNIGAYGQELAEALVAVEFLAEGAQVPRRILADELELGYRTSLFKAGFSGVVTAIELELVNTASVGGVDRVALSQPVLFPQLCAALGVEQGQRVPIAEVRSRVLELRAAKGMLIDPNDRDTASAGSFFTNPIVSVSAARGLPLEAPRWSLEPEQLDTVILLDSAGFDSGQSVALAQPRIPNADGGVEYSHEQSLVKLSAAWLIEHAGIRKGFALPGSAAAVSSKHTLALTNRGDATAAEIAELARFVQSRVHAEFGIQLVPEPFLLGVEL